MNSFLCRDKTKGYSETHDVFDLNASSVCFERMMRFDQTDDVFFYN